MQMARGESRGGVSVEGFRVVKGGGFGGGCAVALCSYSARREGKKVFGWEGHEEAQQQKMSAEAQSRWLTRWCVDAWVVEFRCRRSTFLQVKGGPGPDEEWGQPRMGQKRERLFMVEGGLARWWPQRRRSHCTIV